MSDSPDKPGASPEDEIQRLLEEVRDTDNETRENRLRDVNPSIADEVRKQLHSEARTLYEPSSASLDSEADTRAPDFDAEPPPDSKRATETHELPAYHRRLVGRTLGPYKVQRLIGSGGMGQVWEAIQDKPKRSVALKVIRSAIASPAARERFEFEVEVLGRLQHPGIAQIYDAGTLELDDEQLPYFAMEYIAGALPLDEYARKKKLGISERLRLFTKICDAIAHGHQRGIIHRDLKPANILVDNNGQPKVIDFGVARAMNMDERSTIAKTNVGQLVGTLQYMAPEQCSADPDEIDIRVDVYSLGVLLYELVTDRLPYDLRRSAITEAVRIIQEDTPPRLSTFDGSISVDVEVIAGKALEKDRDRRYRSAGDLADDVRRFLSDEPIMARPPSMSEVLRRYARKNRPMATAAIGVAAALLIGVAGIILFAVEANRERNAKEIANQKLTASLESERTARELAETRFDQLRSLSNQILGPIALEVKNLPGATGAREMMIDAGRNYLQELAAQVPTSALLRYDIAIGHENLGDLLGGHRTGNLGQDDEAVRHYREAEKVHRDLRKRAPEDPKPKQDLARVLLKRADLELKNNPDQAIETVEEARLIAFSAYESGNMAPESVRIFTTALTRMGDFFSDNDQNAKALLFFQQAHDLRLALLESDPTDRVRQRDVALSERRLAWTYQLRDDEQNAQGHWSKSLDRLRAISEAEPDSIRRKWDVSWGCYHYGAFLIMYPGQEQATALLIESVELMTFVCVSSPNEAGYRNDLAQLVPAVHEELVVAGHPQHAESALKSSLLSLQPVVERMPENLALIEVYGALQKLRKPAERP